MHCEIERQTGRGTLRTKTQKQQNVHRYDQPGQELKYLPLDHTPDGALSTKP